MVWVGSEGVEWTSQVGRAKLAYNNAINNVLGYCALTPDSLKEFIDIQYNNHDRTQGDGSMLLTLT